jgi:hydrocephalus-inducing protein
MVFEYTPTADVLVEAFWSFSIPSQGIVVPFLLVGHVSEPRVSLDRPAINFGKVSGLGQTPRLTIAQPPRLRRCAISRPALLLPPAPARQVQLGMRTRMTLCLVNDEHLPFRFALDKASYDASDALLAASGGKPLLDVQPSSGTVPPKSKVGAVL